MLIASATAEVDVLTNHWDPFLLVSPTSTDYHSRRYAMAFKPSAADLPHHKLISRTPAGDIDFLCTWSHFSANAANYAKKDR
jgi:hypothetical protein